MYKTTLGFKERFGDLSKYCHQSLGKNGWVGVENVDTLSQVLTSSEPSEKH